MQRINLRPALPQFNMVKRISCLCSQSCSSNPNPSGGALILLTPQERQSEGRDSRNCSYHPLCTPHLSTCTPSRRGSWPAAAVSQAASHLFHFFAVMHGEITSRDFYTFRKGWLSRSKNLVTPSKTSLLQHMLSTSVSSSRHSREKTTHRR